MIDANKARCPLEATRAVDCIMEGNSSQSSDPADRPAVAFNPAALGVGVDTRAVAPMFGSSGRSDDDVEYLDYNKKGRGWSERMFYNTGMAYGAGVILGGGYGAVEGLRSSPSRRMKIRVNALLNGMGKRGSRVGNAVGAVAVLYSSFESLADYVELEQYTGGYDIVNPIAAAVATGVMYKSTKGPKVMALAGVLGAGLVAGATLGARALRGRGGVLGQFVN